MAAKPVVRARVDEHTKAAAEAILASIGLTVSDAFRVYTQLLPWTLLLAIAYLIV